LPHWPCLVAEFRARALRDAGKMASQLAEIIVHDFSKLGRVQANEIAYAIDAVSEVTRRNPANAAGLLIAPTLASQKVAKGLRGECRRIEDKCDNRDLTPFNITIRMAEPHANKDAAMNYTAWLVVSDAMAEPGPDGEPKNIFLTTELFTARGNKQAASWLPISQHVYPEDKGRVAGRCSEGGNNSRGDAQLAAQLLGGLSVPKEVLTSLLTGAVAAEGMVKAAGQTMLLL